MTDKNYLSPELVPKNPFTNKQPHTSNPTNKNSRMEESMAFNGFGASQISEKYYEKHDPENLPFNNTNGNKGNPTTQNNYIREELVETTTSFTNAGPKSNNGGYITPSQKGFNNPSRVNRHHPDDGQLQSCATPGCSLHAEESRGVPRPAQSRAGEGVPGQVQ